MLERLETEFYTQALAKFKDPDFTAAGFGNVNIPKELFSRILQDEAAHTSVIETQLVALGAEPITTCQFNFGDALKDVATMAATARVVENLGVSGELFLLLIFYKRSTHGTVLSVPRWCQPPRRQVALESIGKEAQAPLPPKEYYAFNCKETQGLAIPTVADVDLPHRPLGSRHRRRHPESQGFLG